jgi:ABC-type Fe3+-hydroxamate transport system substrate-binding protein
MNYQDQIGHTFYLPHAPRRIISLVPSQTEFLFDIGLENEIVGITKFCIHPSDKVANYSNIGGTKNVSLAKIKNLKPDLIIANKEENTKETILALQALYPVYTSDIHDIDSAIAMMLDIGKICQREEQASLLTQNISQHFASLNTSKRIFKSVYLIWRKPWMTVGNDTFIHHIMSLAGFENCFNTQKRYPVLSDNELMDAKPTTILLSSEPYPFKERHINELQRLCPDASIILVDGEMFSWYGSRLLLTSEYLKKLQHFCQETNNPKDRN